MCLDTHALDAAVCTDGTATETRESRPRTCTLDCCEPWRLLHRRCHEPPTGVSQGARPACRCRSPQGRVIESGDGSVDTPARTPPSWTRRAQRPNRRRIHCVMILLCHGLMCMDMHACAHVDVLCYTDDAGGELSASSLSRATASWISCRMASSSCMPSSMLGRTWPGPSSDGRL